MVWIIFLVSIVAFLAFDLSVFNKKSHIIGFKEASKRTAVFVAASFLFSIIVYWLYSNSYIENPDALLPINASIKYLTGYLIELSLSVDNIFVMAIIFSSFKIPKEQQHRVLFWGILGALLFRGILIYFGVLIVSVFQWTTYVFGVFLIYTAIKMLLSKEEEKFDPRKSFVYKSVKKIIPISNQLDAEHFFVKRRHITAATPLLVALIMIEIMDVVFALDSVPAILTITSDPFLVFSSNIFAILGLRSMYFFLANMLEKFSYLEHSIIVILCFVGLKMILKDCVEIPEWVSLTFIALSLLTGVLVSFRASEKKS